MGSGIYIATSGAVAQTKSLDVIANNVANASTIGFKAQRAVFREALVNAERRDVAFVGVDPAEDDVSQGALRQTGEKLDLALVGEGFFAVDTPRGPRYTRAGDFRLDPAGALVNGAGLAARSQTGGKITIPAESSEVAVDPEGRVFADGEEVGQLEIARFRGGRRIREGANLFSIQGAEQVTEDLPEVRSGATEQSNVSTIRGVVDLVRVSRTHQSMMRMIEAYQQIENRTAQIGSGR